MKESSIGEASAELASQETRAIQGVTAYVEGGKDEVPSGRKEADLRAGIILWVYVH